MVPSVADDVAAPVEAWTTAALDFGVGCVLVSRTSSYEQKTDEFNPDEFNHVTSFLLQMII